MERSQPTEPKMSGKGTTGKQAPGSQGDGKGSQKNEGVTIKYIETSKSALKFQEKLIKNKGKKKENNTTFRIDFALASLETQNWNIPLL